MSVPEPYTDLLFFLNFLEKLLNIVKECLLGEVRKWQANISRDAELTGDGCGVQWFIQTHGVVRGVVNADRREGLQMQRRE